MANDKLIRDSRINKISIIICWISIFLGGFPAYSLNSSYMDVLILWAIGSCITIIPTVMFLISHDSKIIKYAVNISGFCIIFGIAYAQKGAEDNVFLLTWTIIYTGIFFNKTLTLFATVLCNFLILILYVLAKPYFFPDYTVSEIITVLLTMTVIGVFVLIQAEWGKRMISNSRVKEEKANELNLKLFNILEKTKTTSEVLDGSIIKLNENAKTTKKEISQISLSINQASKALETQSTNTSASISSIYKIESIIKEVESNSKEMRSSSDLAYAASDDGKNTANELVGQIHTVKSAVDTAVGAIYELNDQSNKINGIVSLIKDVASQINLLSLNASIEAARAGEQGKGFAVVANEIKNLANQTAKSVQDISEILQHITRKINSATNQIGEGNKAVEKGIEITNNSYDRFINISDKVKDIKTKAEKVNGDIDYLSTESASVFKQIENIGKLTVESTAMIEEIASSTNTQNEMLEHFNDLIQVLIEQSKQLKSLIAEMTIQ